MIRLKEPAKPKPKAAVRKAVARPKPTVKYILPTQNPNTRRMSAKELAALIAPIPIEPCPNCKGTGQRPRSMTAAERQRRRRARLKGGK